MRYAYPSCMRVMAVFGSREDQMSRVSLLKERLEAIGQSLAESGEALALLGLGSVGQEIARLDEFSDLDFFAIVKPGSKARFLDNLDWLSRIHPVAWRFQNTVDGFKLLYSDHVFCEFAVFEPEQLAQIPFAPGRVIWSEPGFDVGVLTPTDHRFHYTRNQDRDWLLGEALSNLYVGLGRFHRGEKLSGMKFVQQFAVERLLDLIHLDQEAISDAMVDRYMPDRRLEHRYPQSEELLQAWCPGYDETPAAALAQLVWMETHYGVNSSIAAAIRALANR